MSIAVVGAGPGGLASAMLLAARGLSVTVYEAQATIGGRTARLSLGSSLGEFGFDRGPTFFLMPYVLDQVFAACGRRLSDEVELTRLDPMYRLVVGQRAGSGGARPGEPIVIDTTQDLGAMARRLGELDPRDGAAFEPFMHAQRAKLAALTPVLESGFESPLDLVDRRMLGALPHLNPHLSVHGLLAKSFRHPASRLALSFQSKYLGMSPYDCPSLFTILPFIEYEYGVWHPRGGCNALMGAMARVCREMGVRIVTGTPVAGLEFEGPRVAGVRTTGGEVHRHDHVILNADAPWALKNLIPESLRKGSHGGAALGVPFGASPPYTDSRLDAMKYSCSTMMLYLGLRGRVKLPHHTICVSSLYEENLADIREGRLSEDPSVYICNASESDPTLAPGGCSSLYVLVPTPNGKAASRAGGLDWGRGEADGGGQSLGPAALRTRRQALEIVRRVSGTDIEPMIAAERVVTPEDWRASNIQFGATFNLAHSLDQMLHMRPRHRVPGVEGVWLVGGGTHPGSGLPVIFLSAQITTRKLLDSLGLPAQEPHTHPHVARADGPQHGATLQHVSEIKPMGAAAPATGV